MKALSILALILSLMACQPETTPTDDSAKNAAATSPSSKEPITDNSTSQESNFSVVPKTPYDVIESDEQCEEPVVIEFFAYQCPHCYKLDTYAEKWLKKNDGKIKFIAIPTHLGHEEFGAFLIIHEAARTLGVLDKAMPALFHRLHEEKQGFSSQDDAVAFLVSLGVDEATVKATVSDEQTMKSALDNNFKLLAKYKISGVPTIIVNHRYQFDVTKAGGYDKVFEVVDQTLKLPSNCTAKK